jgi:recombination protein RecA
MVRKKSSISEEVDNMSNDVDESKIEEEIEVKEGIKEKKVTALDIAKKAIIKEYGEGVISLLGSHEDLVIDAISSGCISLDLALGIGGFARGRLYEIYGPNSAGKSTLALSCAMQGLLRGMTVVYVDAEHALDPKLVRNMAEFCGVNTNKVDEIELVQGYTGDDNLEIAEKLMVTGELDIVIVDSVSSLLPKNMADKDIGDNFVGELARLMSKACSKLTPIANRTNTLLMFINQIRHKIGQWGDDRTTSGGEALGFYTTGRIKVEGGESASSRIIDKNDPKNPVVIGHKSKFEIMKNKLAPPYRKAAINLIYGKGYDFKAEVVDMSIDLGIVDKKGAWYYYNDFKWNGTDNFINYIRDDANLYDELNYKVKSGLGMVD